MLPWSRGLRKEFLPLYDRGEVGARVLKPVAHLVVETLMQAGVDDLTLVVRPRDLALVREYFSVDRSLLARHGGHPERVAETRAFYRRLGSLRIRFATQSTPRGFGDAVLRAEPRIGDRPFLLQASDGVLTGPKRAGTVRAMGSLRTAEDLDAVLLVRRVADPRRYGVVEGEPSGRWDGLARLTVHRMVEKPAHPRSHWAAAAVYAFSPRIFPALRATRRRIGPGRELELTDGIGELLRQGAGVAALVLRPSAAWRSVGSPEGYLRALHATLAHARSGG